ncbi:MAG: UDP-N-acetylglucosamine pyrophosphorylase [Rickettsiales bacterium]|nr:UDP-N-acetylglucosamine pyrophosphorylase [Rickettsiales bacterium]|tara:strand:+ start:1292 stop:2044 length:753 start_codon:yes stop_codon:yes gene_type:complete
MLHKTNAIILAAGKGSRMKSDIPKVLHHVAGKPMLSYVLEAVHSCDPNIYVVVGHQAHTVRSTFTHPSLTFVEQTEQLGTGHAVQQVIPYLKDSLSEHTLILAGDCPLIQTSTLESLLETHCHTKAAATILTTHMKDPFGYGRILRTEQDHISGIKEQKDCSEDEASITEINSGIYVFNTPLLLNYIDQLQSNNNQKEYYLTDIIHIFTKNGHTISGMITDDPNEIIGINTPIDLAKVNDIVLSKNNVTM